MARLGDYINITNGYAFKSSSYVDDGIRVMRITNVQKGKITDESPKYYSQETQNDLGKYLINQGEILMSLTGNVGRVGRIPASYLPAYVNQRVCKINISNPALSEDYLYYVLNSDVFERDAINNSSGVAQLNLSTKWIEDYQIPLPPLEEQKQIAAILDAADELRQKDKALIAKYDELTQSLFLDMFGDPVTNPQKWELVELKKCCTKIGSGATPRGGKESYGKEGISLIRSLNIHDNRFKYKDLAFIDEDQAKRLNNVIVEEEDVLFNITGASVCRCAIVPNDVLPARVNQHVAILRPNSDELNPFYLCHLLISENFKTKLLNKGSQGGATREAITKGMLEKLLIPNPDLTHQVEFSDRLRDIESQKARAQESLKKSEELFNSLLQKAFKGELTN